MRKFLTIVFALSATATSAEPLQQPRRATPVPQTGAGCPPGYSGSPTSGYCSSSAGAGRAVPQRGTGCPSGFSLSPTSGYCVETIYK